ncbi:MAG TPA: GNAT family protein [Acetobacteraceae bacterium]|jgi:RimJ/RimL family protein N-acetyltransferase
MSTPPIGPEIDPTPRPLPARVKLRGTHVELEPLHRRHAEELWRAAQAGDAKGDNSWAYLGYGPFPSPAAMEKFVAEFASTHDPMAWAVRPVATGVVTGWLTLKDIQSKNAAIELGNIWFGPALQRTRASTEAMFLLLRLAADDLGYRRLVWKCNALNAPSRRAAERLGFTYEGRHRAHMVVKGRLRDTDWYSITDQEWPRCRDAILAWLAPTNFTPDGTARQSLATLRALMPAD